MSFSEGLNGERCVVCTKGVVASGYFSLPYRFDWCSKTIIIESRATRRGLVVISESFQLSVIVPVFNQEKRISACIESILAQEGISLEVICIDDGSTDGTLNVLNELKARDSRVVVVEQSNHGAGYSRNIGLTEARGEYVIFCDADDRIPDVNVYFRLYRAAKDHKALVSAGSFSLLDWENAGLQTEFSGLLDGYTFREEGFISYEDYQFDYGFTRFMFRTDFLLMNDLWFPLYTRYEDPVFLVSAMIAAERFYAIPDVVYECNTGHQCIRWNKPWTLALLAGIADVLELSASHGLQRLHALTLDRIDGEFGVIIRMPLCDKDILAALVNLDCKVDWSMVRPDQLSRDRVNDDVCMVQPLKAALDDLQWRGKLSKIFAHYASALGRRVFGH